MFSEATGVTLGSSDSDAFSYDPNTGRMTQYGFTVGNSSVTGGLTWNANWTLQQLAITDPFNSSNQQTCTMSYDDVVRVAAYNCSPNWNQSFSFDPFGNISKTGLGGGALSFQPTYNASTNQISSVGGQTYSYDANGNLTNAGTGVSSTAYTWDAEGNMLSVAPYGSTTVGLTFDALGRMVEQNRNGSYTQIVYSPLGGKLAVMSGQTLAKAFVPLSDRAQAVYTSGPTLSYYRHADWLGSSRLASTPTQTVYYDGAYAPYGEPYAESGTTDLSFTGQNADTVGSMYDFLYREYAVQGRWISPDPAGLAAVIPANPQSFNSYGYVVNNPMALIDPLGLQCVPGTPGYENDCPAPPSGGDDGGGGGDGGAAGGGPGYQPPCAALVRAGPSPEQVSGCLGPPGAPRGRPKPQKPTPPPAPPNTPPAQSQLRPPTQQEYNACMQQAASTRDSALLSARGEQVVGGLLSVIGVAAVVYSVPTLNEAFFNQGLAGAVDFAHAGGFAYFGALGPLGVGAGTFGKGTYDVASAWNQYYANTVGCAAAVPSQP